MNNGRAALKLNALQLDMKRVIEQKIQCSDYHFESIPCAICKGNDFELLAEKERYGLYAPTVICKSCGLLQMNPRMTQDSYNRFYNEEYRNLYCADGKCTEYFFEDQKIHGQNIYNFIIPFVTAHTKDNPPSVLEVGCGAGGILQAFKEKGYRIKGLDLGTAYLKYGTEKYGLNLSHGTIHSYHPEQKVDIVIYSHVLEHILDLNTELERVSDILADDGILYIEVPSPKNLIVPYWGDFMLYLQNAHVYHFSLQSLKNVLSQNGFECVSGNEAVCSIFKISKSSAAEITNDYEPLMRQIRKSEWIVRFGLSKLLRVIIPTSTWIIDKIGADRYLRELYIKMITTR